MTTTEVRSFLKKDKKKNNIEYPMRLLAIMISGLLFSCDNNHPTSFGDLQIGKPVPSSAKPIDTILFANMVLYKPNEFKLSKLIDYNGIVYNVCLDTSKNIVFILTGDKNFSSPDGYKVGDSFSMLKKSSIVKKMFIPGYGVEVLLPSGWTITFLDQAILDSSTASDTSTIKSFYKRID